MLKVDCSRRARARTGRGPGEVGRGLGEDGRARTGEDGGGPGCFPPWRGAQKQPISVNGAFPFLKGPFSDLNGRFPECLNGPFSLLKIPWKTDLS